MKIHILIVLLLVSMSMFAQDTIQVQNVSDLNNVEYVFLFSNKIIKGKTVTYTNPKVGDSYIKVNNLEFPSKSVKFFQNSEGFYANIDMSSMNNGFAERLKTGKINLYEYDFTKYTYYTDPVTGEGRKKTYKGKREYFYNSGFENLAVVNYKNLKINLKSSQESMVFLEKYKKKEKSARINMLLGSVMVTTGLITSINKAKKSFGTVGQKNSYIVEGFLLFGGGGLMRLGYKKNLNKNEDLVSAIDVFNQ